MRVRSKALPPSKSKIELIREKGVPPPPTDSNKCEDPLIGRLRQACYLDCHNNPLSHPFDRLLAQYRKDGLVLFLGAGVSSCSGVPNWPDLIRKVFSQIDLGESDYETVKWAFPDLLAQFDLAGHKLDSRRDFVKKLCDCLYGDVKFKEIKDVVADIPKKRNEQCAWPKWEELLGKLRQNKTLEAVGELLLVKSAEQWTRNPQIHAVLTTNADNLLELYCKARTSGARLLTMVDRASVGDHPETTPVYHLHGMLDARGENILRDGAPCNEVPRADLQEIDDQLLPSLVFRESEYYETLASPTGFVNHTPQSYFQRLNVLFIGTSLDDLNIRRWLHSSFRERVEERTKYLREYYCRKYDDVKVEAELESVRHFWLRTKTERREKCGVVYERELPMELVELSMRKLGVQVVWCDSYRDVCRNILCLRKKGRNLDSGRR